MKRSNVSPNRKIQHIQRLQSSDKYSSLIEAYKTQVLTQKTRTIRLLGRKSSAKIIHTLLGFEVQASYKRIQCPDLVTARYLRLFSELGCHSIKLPYDPTLTEKLIPEFEAAVDGMNQAIRDLFTQDVAMQRNVTRRVYATIRRHLAAL
jgi:hypothetical protein